MDDLSEKLAAILNDPKSLEQVRQMAESLLGGQDAPKTAEAPAAGAALPDMGEVQKIMEILARLRSSDGDSRTALLLALRPHLSEPRQEKVDTAVKILRLIDLLPVLRESGLLSL